MDDQAEFSAFVTASSRSLQRAAWLLTGDWSAAEDLVQAALVKTWTRWDRIDHAAAHAYARQVLMTTFLGWRARRWTGEVALGWIPEYADDRDVLTQLDLRAALVAALLKLPRQQRAVVVLRYFEDLTEAATAKTLGCSVGTIKSQASRALARLRAVPGLNPVFDERTS